MCYKRCCCRSGRQSLQWQAIAAMADRIGTEIESDTEVKMTNSAGDETVEYAIHYAQMAPTHQTSQREMSGIVQNYCIDCYHYERFCHCNVQVLCHCNVQVLVTSIGGPYSGCRRGSKCCSEISSGGPYLSTKLVPGGWSI